MNKSRKNKSGLGKALSNNISRTNKGKRHVDNNSMLHTSEIKDGYDWGRLNLRSVTEESSLEQFLSVAEQVSAEYEAQKHDVTFIGPSAVVGLMTKKEEVEVKKLQEKYKKDLKIPRRPKWDYNMTPEQLDQNEKEQFLEWRRRLIVLEEEKGLIITPYERNLEFWRQLWRVVERSDAVIQIADARNPLLFYCDDLIDYVKEVSEDKLNLILLNKADFLTEEQRQHWADYFKSKGIKSVFFSAIVASQVEETITEEASSEVAEIDSVEELSEKINQLDTATNKISDKLNNVKEQISDLINENNLIDDLLFNSNKILSRLELIELFHNIKSMVKKSEDLITIGLVGYPNVGKSSTINALLKEKKVSVSATPGKTKHFQTFYLDQQVMLCDCPGLVMPTFAFTKAEMVINGILPIDQLKDHRPPVNLLTNLIPRHVLEKTYSILLPEVKEEDSADRLTPEELLNAYGFSRGFMTPKNQPDNAKAARYILKDFVNGKLLYCYSPPGVAQDEYHTWPPKPETNKRRAFTPAEFRAVVSSRTTKEDIDKQLFNSKEVHHSKAVNRLMNQQDSSTVKPWRLKQKLKAEEKRRDKLRRVYAHLDQH